MTSLTASHAADVTGMRALKPYDPPMIGPYRLVGELGFGGMGRMFLGRSAGGGSVAGKVVHAGLAADPEFRMRCARRWCGR
jgi:hypothetical protein